MIIKTLSELRQEQGLSQKKLAKYLDISSASIGMYETGQRNPPLSTAIKIAKFFGLPVESISFSNEGIHKVVEPTNGKKKD